MKDRSWQKWEIAGLLVTLAAGNTLHFVYDWSGGSTIAAVFAAVNESTWEHMKLLAVPWLLWTVLQAAVLRNVSVLPGRALGLLTGLAAIPLLFYGYTGALGVESMIVDIAIFQVAVLLGFLVSWLIQSHRKLTGRFWQILAALVLLGVAAVFVWWTFQPPRLPVFIDPTTGLTGPGK